MFSPALPPLFQIDFDVVVSSRIWHAAPSLTFGPPNTIKSFAVIACMSCNKQLGRTNRKVTAVDCWNQALQKAVQLARRNGVSERYRPWHDAMNFRVQCLKELYLPLRVQRFPDWLVGRKGLV